MEAAKCRCRAAAGEKCDRHLSLDLAPEHAMLPIENMCWTGASSNNLYPGNQLLSNNQQKTSSQAAPHRRWCVSVFEGDRDRSLILPRSPPEAHQLQTPIPLYIPSLISKKERPVK